MLKVLTLTMVIVAATTTSAKRIREMYSRRQMRNYGDPVSMLSSQEDLILMMVSQYLWLEQNWWCMVSRYVSTVERNTTYQRKRFYWIPPSRYSFNNTVPQKRGSLLYQYQIVRQKGEYTKLNTTFYAGDTRYHEGLLPVYYADEFCMIVGMYEPPGYRGMPLCALWFKNSTISQRHDYCFFILLEFCRTPIYNLREYEQEKCNEWGSTFPNDTIKSTP